MLRTLSDSLTEIMEGNDRCGKEKNEWDPHERLEERKVNQNYQANETNDQKQRKKQQNQTLVHHPSPILFLRSIIQTDFSLYHVCSSSLSLSPSDYVHVFLTCHDCFATSACVACAGLVLRDVNL